MASILKAVRVGSSGLFGRLKHKSEFNSAFFVGYIFFFLLLFFFCGIVKISLNFHVL